MKLSSIEKFLKMEASGGIILIFSAVAALIMANSPLSALYSEFLNIPVAIQTGQLIIAKPLLLWINDGLMAVFFFLIGLEIKREFIEGELSTPSQITLPAFAAIGGMIVPAAIYIFINQDNEAGQSGWAIPTATDIAFALGILALVGSRVPISLKILLTAIAIFDDLGAIIIIAFFYTDSLSLTAVISASLAIIALFTINRMNVRHPAAYVLLGIVLWICVLKSGVHATLAGVITAFAIPIGKDQEGHSMLKHMEHSLHPWIAFGILPLFAFANAGISFKDMGLDSFLEPVKLGVSMGLFLGKQIGVFGMLWLCIIFRITPMPKGCNWPQLYGISLLCGVGFTMSLFISSLAFEHADFDAPVRLGVLSGSVLCALLGYFLLRYATKKGQAEEGKG